MEREEKFEKVLDHSWVLIYRTEKIMAKRVSVRIKSASAARMRVAGRGRSRAGGGGGGRGSRFYFRMGGWRR